MQEATNPMASGVQPHAEASTIHTLPLSASLPAAFTLKGVYQMKAGITVVDDVEVDIPHGEIIALVGPSGAGKTSLLRLLNRLDDPVRGEILYRARPITHYPAQALRRQVGFVFQTPVMFPGTVRDNLQVGPRTRWRVRTRRRRAHGRSHGPRGTRLRPVRPGRRSLVRWTAAAREHRPRVDDLAGCVTHG
jgi:ABC-type sugar transport system ATPase subunit